VWKCISDYPILHEFSCKQSDGGTPIQKAFKYINFLRYRKLVLKVLKNNDFDFIIALHTFPAFLMAKELVGKYKGRYIFDYRDSTYEKYSFFKKRIGKLVNNSYATFVSSDGFRPLLPDAENVYTSHNLLIDSLSHREVTKDTDEPLDKIKISFWGLLRNRALNFALVDKIASDERFELHYYGREQNLNLSLKEYVNEKQIKNVYFHGEYKPEERYDFVRKTDIIHNIYNDDNSMINMTNKYYDGAIFRLPQLCFDGTFMGKRAEEAGIGISCSPFDDGFTDKVYNYYKSINRESFNLACDNELDRIMNEYTTGCDIISGIQDKKEEKATKE